MITCVFNIAANSLLMTVQSCEKLRVALEETEVERDMENFVRDYGTGNMIPDPPGATDYNSPDAIPASSSDLTYHHADFGRVTRPHKKRPVADKLTDEDPPKSKRDHDIQPSRHSSPSPSPIRPPIPLEEEEPLVNMAGLGAGTAKVPTEDPPVPVTNGNSNVSRKATSVSRKAVVDPNTGETIAHNAETFMKIGDSAYKVDLSNDPQAASSAHSSIASPRAQTPAGSIDPLAKTLEELTREVSTTGSIRRNGTYRQSQPPPPPPPHVGSSSYQRNGPSPSPAPSRKQTLDAPSTQPVRSASPSRDYRNSAEMVVGVHPSVSRSTSPNVVSAPAGPTAAFMQPRNSMGQGPSESDIQGMLADYQQSLPGERKSIGQSASRRASFSAASPSNENVAHHAHTHSQSLARPPSGMGHAGVGAHGGSRSASPQPMSRGPSPAPGYIVPPLAPSPSLQRAKSPNDIGIALDASGRVMHDEMALRYQQQQQQQQPPRHAPPPQQQAPPPPHQQPMYQPPPPPQQQQPMQRQPTYIPPPPPPVQAIPIQQPSYASPAAPGYRNPPYSAPPPQTQYPPAPSYPAYSPPNSAGVQRGPSTGGGYYGNGPPAPAAVRQMSAHVQSASGGYQPASYGRHTTPSPQPPPPSQPPAQDDPVLFYGASVSHRFDLR